MPAVSLVVCVHGQIDLLRRLLSHSAECYDDLVVVHDGAGNAVRHRAEHRLAMARDYSIFNSTSLVPPEYTRGGSSPPPNSIQALVEEHGGRYFEGPRCLEQEPHWPFAWSQARHDWILRWDADEFPSADLVAWLRAFRASPEPAADVSTYTCVWPLWNGIRETTSRWPGGRVFLINRRRNRFFGMVEQGPIPDGQVEPLDLLLHHQPKRKSYGIRNILFRRQAYHWRRVISESLMGKPTDLPCWRWTSPEWPEQWQHLRSHPLQHGLSALVRYPLRQLISMSKAGVAPNLSAAFNPGLHHFLLGLRVRAEKQRRRKA